MPDLSVSERQLERLEEISAELETVYVGEYGTVRPADTLEYLLDTYTPPDADGTDQAGSGADADPEALTAIDGIGEATAEALVEAGFGSIDRVAAADPDSLAEIKGLSREQAADISASAAAIGSDDDGGENVTADGADDGGGEDPTTDAEGDDGGDGSDTGGDSPEDTLKQAMSLLDAHDERWRESGGDEPYEVDLPDGSTTGARTKDDIKRLIFKHWR